MTVEDVMTRRGFLVRPETTVQEAARLMFTNRISGIPVVAESGRVVGLVSDGDLIVRQRRPKPKPWWRLFCDGQLVGIVSRGDLIKALAATAKPPTVESHASDASQASTGKRDRPRRRTGEP